MADNRTGLSAADVAEQFRDVCGDGSIEWVSMAWQTWVLLDAADMLEEFADAPKCETCEAMLDCDECLRADASQKERKRLDYENERLRELVRDMYACISHANEQDWFYFERDKFGCGMSCTVNGEACGLCALANRMRELGVEA